MPFPVPVPGLVIRYFYLWAAEHARGQEEGVKDRPCAIVKRRLKLDDERSWVVLAETNRFTWPGPDLRHFRYGRAHFRHGRTVGKLSWPGLTRPPTRRRSVGASKPDETAPLTQPRQTRPRAPSRAASSTVKRAHRAMTLDVMHQTLHARRNDSGYRDKRTAQFGQGEFVRAFQGFESQAARRLAILNVAPSLGTLRILPSNRLEALRGDRTGQFRVRINQQWRVCFEWPDGQPGPGNVESVDYH